MAWYADFMSMNGTSYRIEIGGSGGSEIICAPDPFVTSENDDADIFTPIRGQTGTLRVIDTSGTLLEDMIPANNTSTTVVLKSGNTVKWRGFLGAEVYTQPWDGNAHVLEFQVISMLEALKYTTIESTYRNQRLQCQELVNNAFSSLGLSVTLDTSKDDMYGWWKYYVVICSVFFNDKTICNQGIRETVSEGLTYYSVVESVCKLFGLSAREKEGTVYFTTYDTASITPSDLISNFVFKGTDNSETFAQGAIRAAVVLDIDDNVQKITIPPTEETADTPYELTVNTDKTVFVQAHPDRSNIQETFTYKEYDVYALIGSSNYNGMLAHSLIDGYTANPYNSHDTHLYTGAFPVRWFYRKDSSDIVRLVNGMYLQTQYHRASGTPVRNLCYSIKSSEGFGMSEGYLNIAFDVYNFVYDTDSGGLRFTDSSENSIDTEMNVAIRIGDKFWNKGDQEWQTQQSGETPLDYRFVLSFKNEKIVTNKTVDMLVDKTDGYFIPANNMQGEVELYIFNASYTNNNGDTLHPLISYAKIISNFEVSYLQSSSITASDRNTNEYRQTIMSSGFSDERVININIGTFNNNLASPSFVREVGGTYYLESVHYTTGYERPEMHLLGRMVDYYGQIRRNMLGVVGTGKDLINGLWSYGGHIFVGIDSHHNWRDDVQNVKFVEIKDA